MKLFPVGDLNMYMNNILHTVPQRDRFGKSLCTLLSCFYYIFDFIKKKKVEFTFIEKKTLVF